MLLSDAYSMIIVILDGGRMSFWHLWDVHIAFVNIIFLEVTLSTN